MRFLKNTLAVHLYLVISASSDWMLVFSLYADLSAVFVHDYTFVNPFSSHDYSGTTISNINFMRFLGKAIGKIVIKYLKFTYI